MKKQLKRFTATYSDDGDWINNTKRARNLEEADIIIIPGGVDVSPTYYKEPRGAFTQVYHPSDRDIKESAALRYAFNEGKYAVGICRGNQLINVLAGGKLIQHVNNHHGQHVCNTIEGDTIRTNSIHHQMCYPWDLPTDEYIVLSWTEGISNTYLDGWDQEIKFPDIALTNEGKVIEPEIIWYPKKRWLGVQFHPEMMWFKSVEECYTLDYLNNVLNNVIDQPYYYHETHKHLIK